MELFETAISFGQPLMDIGLDSLASSHFVKLISEGLKIELPPTLIFDNPTLEAIIDSLLASPRRTRVRFETDL